MIHELIRLRNRNQLTLPAEMVEYLGLKPEGLVELILDRKKGHVELRRAEVVRAGTPQAEQAEKSALKSIEEGKFSTFANPQELARSMEKTQARDMQEQIELLREKLDGLSASLTQMKVDESETHAHEMPTAARS
jgi:bifunctional DNA-binding transcriptional regulator/antitoxin component of YhaV-PrlF toxin-antitoxin module